MEFSFIHSLKHLAFVQVTAAMFNHIEVKLVMSQIKNIPTDFRNVSEWQWVLKRLIYNAQKLPTIELLKSELLEFVENMGRRIELWFDYHKKRYPYIRMIPDKFFWNGRGTLDAKKMTKTMISELLIAERYELACTYCLKGLVFDLCLSNHLTHYFEELEKNGDCLEVVWTDIADDELFIRHKPKNDGSFEERGFWISALSGNELGTIYFFKKLTPEQKQKLLVTTAIELVNYDPESDPNNFQEEYYTDVLCFMLSAMTVQQLREFLPSCANDVLERMAVWPWSCFLAEAEAVIQNYLPPNQNGNV